MGAELVNFERSGAAIGARNLPLWLCYAIAMGVWFYLVLTGTVFGQVVLPLARTIFGSAPGSDALAFTPLLVVAALYACLMVGAFSWLVTSQLGRPLMSIYPVMMQTRYFVDDERTIPDPRYTGEDNELVVVRPSVIQAVTLALALVGAFIGTLAPILFLFKGVAFAVLSTVLFSGIATDPAVFPGVLLTGLVLSIPVSLALQLFSGGTQIYDYYVCAVERPSILARQKEIG